MRRKDREMDHEFGLGVIDKARYAVMTTLGPEGLPYSFPISIARRGNCLYVHSALEGRKIENLRHNDWVTLVFVGDTRVPEPLKPGEYEALKASNQLAQLVANKFTTEFESAIATGRAHFVTDPQEQMEGLRVLCEKLTPLHMAYFEDAVTSGLTRTAVIRVEIESLTAKRKKYDANGVEMKWGRRE